MGKIVLLDELTINQIAAGEVIERPASVVKEMVENSIDAGANNITIEIKNGGISYIKITDNGKGIANDDLEIAFERHATSKIRQAEDLDTVMTMGFRGEALASIAAIANVEMVSKTKDAEIGYRIVVEGGNVLSKEQVGCPSGTSITVRNLFYNTPVRYKFLKKDFTESGYIEDVITRLALVNTHIAFKLINAGKTILQTNGSGRIKDVIYSVYGRDIAEGIIETNYTYDNIEITGVVGKPEIARSNRAYQLFFVNNRFVKDKSLSAGIEQAFKGMIPIGKYAFAVLNIKMNPSEVDVNVHPAKLEVRFEDESKIFKAVYHTVKDTLFKEELVSNPDKEEGSSEANRQNRILFEHTIIQSEEPKKVKEDAANNTQITIEPKEDIELFADDGNADTPQKEPVEIIIDTERNYPKQAIEESEELDNEQEILENTVSTKDELIEEIENTNIEKINEVIINAETNIAQEIEQNIPYVQENEIQEIEQNTSSVHEIETSNMPEMEKTAVDEYEISFEEMYAKTFGKKPVMTEYAKEEEDEIIKKYNFDEELTENNMENMSIFEESEEYKVPTYKFIGIAFSSYIILEMDNNMYILDQHAAHERILYERVKKNYYSDEQKDSQLLLLPDIITLSHKEMQIAKENMAMFAKAGFMVEEFGDNTIKLSGVPNMCIDLETRELFLETLDEINTVARTAKREIEERFIATVACKAAVKANMALAKEEVDALMEELLKLPNPFTCPHGRPTVIKMSRYDIDKKFARR